MLACLSAIMHKPVLFKHTYNSVDTTRRQRMHPKKSISNFYNVYIAFGTTDRRRICLAITSVCRPILEKHVSQKKGPSNLIDHKGIFFVRQMAHNNI